MKERIYLDNSATTRVDEIVLEAMLPCFRENFGNASSVHIFGQEARAVVEDARRSVAELLGADTREIVFTSGGTESDNAALWGVFRSGYRPGNHVITTKIEHPAILATCKALESAGAEVTYVPVDASGRVDPGAIEEAMRESTILISVMHANNETGVIQPIEEISAIARTARNPAAYRRRAVRREDPRECARPRRRSAFAVGSQDPRSEGQSELFIFARARRLFHS